VQELEFVDFCPIACRKGPLRTEAQRAGSKETLERIMRWTCAVSEASGCASHGAGAPPLASLWGGF
jgi:hypothetical protein